MLTTFRYDHYDAPLSQGAAGVDTVLDLSNLKFTVRQDDHQPHIATISAAIVIHAEVKIDRHLERPISMKVAEQCLREQIWNSVYGELMPLVFELEGLAIRLDGPNGHRALELSEKINLLLLQK